MPMPFAMAVFGLSITVGSPPIRISPLVGVYIPYS